MNLYESIVKESTLKESNNDTVVAMECQRTGYGPDQVMYDSVTVGELINILQDFDQDLKIVTSHDRGYTYGPIDASDFEEIPANDDEDEDDYEEEELEDSEKPDEGYIVFQRGGMLGDSHDLEDKIFATREEAQAALKSWKDSYGKNKSYYRPEGNVYKYKGQTPKEMKEKAHAENESELTESDATPSFLKDFTNLLVKHCRTGVKELSLDGSNTDKVIVTYENGTTKEINIAADSNLAAISDIVAQLLKD